MPFPYIPHKTTMIGNLLPNDPLLTGDGADITATAGGGQTNAFLLPDGVNEVKTVATAADSVKLPPARAGMVVWLINKGANSMQVYGSGIDTINEVATATGVSHGAGQDAAYICRTSSVAAPTATAGEWYQFMSINSNGGLIGDTVTATLASGSAVSLSNGASANVTSISLGAGTWLVRGQVDFNSTSATTTVFQMGISATSATLPTQAGGSGIGTDALVSDNRPFTTTSTLISLSASNVLVTLTATTTIYLVANLAFSAGSSAAYGTITGVRIR